MRGYLSFAKISWNNQNWFWYDFLCFNFRFSGCRPRATKLKALQRKCFEFEFIFLKNLDFYYYYYYFYYYFSIEFPKTLYATCSTNCSEWSDERELSGASKLCFVYLLLRKVSVTSLILLNVQFKRAKRTTRRTQNMRGKEKWMKCLLLVCVKLFFFIFLLIFLLSLLFMHKT